MPRRRRELASSTPRPRPSAPAPMLEVSSARRSRSVLCWMTSGLDTEVPHHAHVLVLEVVAVVQEEALVFGETDAHPGPFARHQEKGVLPAFVYQARRDRRRRWLPRRGDRAAE